MVDPIIPSPYQLVTNVVVTLVKPLQKTAHVGSIDPNPLDLPFVDLYVPVLFAYRLVDNSEAVYLQVINRIRDGLQKVLVPFFSFAGRWVAGGRRERLLLCNDEGVPFIEASVDKDMDAVVHTNLEFQAVPDLHGYSVVGMDFKSSKQQLPPDGLPLIFVQVTRFRCGGLVLAVNFSHLHTDLKGFFNFMTAWSDLSRDNKTAVEVDHNKEQLYAVTECLSGMDSEPSGNPIDSNDDPDLRRPWVMKSWEVSASAIKSLKEEVRENSNGPGFVSTEDCIAAHVWSSLARIPSSMFRGRDPRIMLVVEGRRKFFDSPLPDAYLGNCIIPFLPAKIPMEELVEMPLASTACRIREQLETTTREEWLDSKRVRNFFAELNNGKIVMVSMTSWLKSPLYEMDFGIGRPFFARGVTTLWNYGRPQPFVGTASIAPPLPGGSPSSVATLSIFTFPEVLQALELDPLFQSFFVAQEKLITL